MTWPKSHTNSTINYHIPQPMPSILQSSSKAHPMIRHSRSGLLYCSLTKQHHAYSDLVQNFILKLKDHLLPWLLAHDYDGDEQTFSCKEWNSIQFVNSLNRVLCPKCLQINYTTYDMHCDQDTLCPEHGATIMLLSHEDGPNAHPFWYAEVLGAFVITIHYSGIEQTMEFLWDCWFGVIPGYHWGFNNVHLLKIGFIPSDSGAAFGFIDPSLVLYACHLIPVFVDGCTASLLCYGPSVAQQTDVFDDWAACHVNMCVYLC